MPRYTWYGQFYRDHQNARQDIGTVTAEYKFNESITLSTKFRKANGLLDYIGTLPQGPNYQRLTIGIGAQSRYQTAGVFANVTELQAKFDTGPVRHTSLVGTELSHEQIGRNTYSGLTTEVFGSAGGGNQTPILTPYNFGIPSVSPFLSLNPTSVSVITKSAYAIHTANWNDFVILNGGVRVDDYMVNSVTPTALRAAVLLNNGNPYNSFAYNHSTMFNYNAGIVIKPIPIASIYGAYATSSNPVGAELDAGGADYGGVTATNTVLGPEKNKAIEAGVKMELFDRKLLATAAVFQTTKDNARETINTTIVGNSAYKIQGLDIEVAGKITDEWSIIGGAVFMNTRVTKSPIPTNVGLPLANIAHTSFSLLSKYQVLPWLELGGQAVYNSKRYGGNILAANGAPSFNGLGQWVPTAANPFLNVPNILPAYWRFDSFAEFKMADGIKGKFAVYNIFNRTYYDGFYRSTVPFVQMAPGRVIQFTATATF